MTCYMSRANRYTRVSQVEVATKLLLWGPVGYWRESPLHRLDLLLVFVALVGTVLEVAGAVDRHTALLMNFLRCAAVSRVLLAFCTMMRLQDRRFIRLVRILRALPGFDLTAWAFTDILPVWLQYAANMICLLYVFAVCHADDVLPFGGSISFLLCMPLYKQRRS